VKRNCTQTCGVNITVGAKTLRVGVVYWHQDDGLAAQTSRLAENLGHEAVNFLYDETLPQNLDVILAYGPFGSLVPLGSQLVACPVSQRPAFVWLIRSRVERLAFSERSPGKWQPNPWLRWLTTKAHRFRYYGDLYWLQRQGILSTLVTRSPWKAGFLRARGFDPMVPPSPSYFPGWGADLKLERDIPVLWIGKLATARRRRLLQRLRGELKARGVEILMIDGVENPYVFGEERTILLNRTKIVLNLLRQKWDNNSMRYTLAAQNRALIVTEPTLPHTSFVHRVHIVEVPIEHMADTICYYLSHEDERQKIVSRAYKLVRKTSLENTMAQILDQAILVRHQARNQKRN
jgi:hypothetical protein